MIMKVGMILTGLAAVAVAAACAPTEIHASAGTKPAPNTMQEMPANAQTLVVAGGCFWCVEAIYEELNGVLKVESGYAGGTVANPKYAEVSAGTTGHAEAVRISFDPKVVTESDLLHIFLTTHDPTTLNRQGGDVGTQYRSAVFYANDEEKSLAQKVIDEVDKEKIWPSKIVTTLEPLTTFYLAEDYHQDYFDKFEKADEATRAEMNTGYCRAVIEPKVRKFRAKYADKLKKRR